MQRRQLRVFISGGDWGRDVLLKNGAFVDGVFYKSGWRAGHFLCGFGQEQIRCCVKARVRAA
jgi:hypothetical protein